MWWIISISLAVIAVTMVLRPGGGFDRTAFAQSSRSAGAHGIYSFSGQIGKNAYGVFMVDVDMGTIWCYRFDQGSKVLTLVAGRDWNFDRHLKNWSTSPPPEVIEQELEKRRAAQQKSGG